MWSPSHLGQPSRDFTPAELARIRELTSTLIPWPRRDLTDELEAIHAAAARVRGFMVWELGPDDGPERAFQEEVRGGIVTPSRVDPRLFL